MTSDEEVLVEQYFKCKNMDETSRNFFINLILNSKELTDSEFNISVNSNSSYDLVYLTLKNERDYISFSGAISNKEENKVISGAILIEGNNYCIYTDVHRFVETLSDRDKDYHVTDEFIFDGSSVLRKSTYNNQKYYETNITLKTDEEMESYYKNKIGTQMKR